MWLPGHVALSFLICIPLLVWVKRERVLALFYVIFFSLLPDFLHIGQLRVLSHSILGLAIILLLTFGALFVLFRPRPMMYVIGIVAAIGHLLGDLYIGSIHPFWPFDETWYHLHQFNTSFDIATEVVLSMIALLLAIVLFGPLRLHRSRRRLDQREGRNLYLLASLVGAMTLLQGGYYALVLHLEGGSTLHDMLLMFFAVPLAFTASILLPMTFPKLERGGPLPFPSSSGLRKY